MTQLGRKGWIPSSPSAIWAIALIIFAVIIALSHVARADDASRPAVDMVETARLDVSLGYGGKPVPGMRFDLFRVGDVSQDGTMRAEEELSDVLTDEMLSSKHVPSSTIKTVAARCDSSGEQPVATGVTDSQGSLSFGGDEGISVGLYVVVGRETKVAGKTYETLPFLVWLPQWDEGKGMWLYWVIASPKPEVIGGGGSQRQPNEPEGDPSHPSNPSGSPDGGSDGWGIPSDTGIAGLPKKVLDFIGELIQTGQGIPVLAGVILLGATVVEVVMSRMRKRAEG